MRTVVILIVIAGALAGGSYMYLSREKSTDEPATEQGFEGKRWDLTSVTWDSGESRTFTGKGDLFQWEFDPATSKRTIRIFGSDVSSSSDPYTLIDGVIRVKDADGTDRSYTWKIDAENRLVLTRQGPIPKEVMPPGGTVTVDEVYAEGGPETRVATTKLAGGIVSEPRTMTFVLDRL